MRRQRVEIDHSATDEPVFNILLAVVAMARRDALRGNMEAEQFLNYLKGQ